MDPWLSGSRFPYYHFGTYLFALPARAARVPSEYAYNLIAALLPALAALAAYGAVRTRGGGRRLALLAGSVLVLGGTFDGARQALGDKPLSDLDWWASSRRVENAITEWPLFTFRLGDLHPHAVTFPFLLAFAGLAGRVGTASGTLLDGVLLAAVLSANPWDLPACLLVLAAGNLAERPFRPAVVRSVFSVLLAVPFLLPFLRSPRPALHGLTFWKEATTAGEAFLHFGVLAVVPALAFGVALVRSQSREDRALVAATAFPALGLALAVLTKRPVFGLAAGLAAGVLWLLFREPAADEAPAPSGRAPGRVPLRGRGRRPRLRAGRRPRLGLVRRPDAPDEHGLQDVHGSVASPRDRRRAPPAARALDAPRPRPSSARPSSSRRAASSRTRSRPPSSGGSGRARSTG